MRIFVAYTEIFSITMNYLLLASKLEPSLTMINETFGEREKPVCHQKQKLSNVPERVENKLYRLTYKTPSRFLNHEAIITGNSDYSEVVFAFKLEFQDTFSNKC